MSAAYTLDPIGRVESPLTDRADAPKQGMEGAPDAWIVLRSDVAEAARELTVGDEAVVVTWLHLAVRDVLRVHPRGEVTQRDRGVFSTRAPDRPNPVGLHQVRVLAVDGLRIRVAGLEAIDGTPVIDLKSVLAQPGVAGPKRPKPQRVHDTRRRLGRDVDVWVASADPDTGTPYLVPLSFLWEDEVLWLATAAAAPTARNLQATGRLRLGFGHTRDVTLVEGHAEAIPAAQIGADLGDRFAAATGFDPRAESGEYLYFRVTPDRIQAWREVDEIAGRTLMRDGRWLA